MPAENGRGVFVPFLIKVLKLEDYQTQSKIGSTGPSGTECARARKGAKVQPEKWGAFDAIEGGGGKRALGA